MTIIFGTLCVAAIFSIVCKKEKTVRVMAGLFATLVAGSVIYFVQPAFFGQSVSVGEWWFVDSFSALMATLISVLYLLAAIVSRYYIGHELHEGIITEKDTRIYFALLHLFIMSMLVVVLTNHALILWLALEATTLTSTFLVGLYRKKTSIEAAWKYIIICSTGITLGLIGILLLGYGANGAGESGSVTFLLTSLLGQASLISAKVVKLSFVFLFVGFGAKVGFVPTHTWLPDAHGNAPSPISALFSGILLNVALYAIVRFQLITDRALGSHDWTGNFFLVFGILSIVLPAFMMLIQHNYKRMLAYSSIEHMGLISLGLALPPVGTLAAIIHMTGHAFIKSSLFFGAGEILLHYKTTHADKIRGMLVNAPYTAVLFTIGILMIVALPPSVLLVSEYALFVVLIKTHIVLAALTFVSLSVIAYAMLKLTLGMVLAPATEGQTTDKEEWNITHTIIAGELLIVAVLSIWLTTGSGQALAASIAGKLF